MKLFLAVLLLGALLASPAARDNENRTLDLVAALGHGRLSVDEELARGPTVDRAFADGHSYSGGAPGLAFALAPAGLLLRSLLEGPRLIWALTVLGASLPLALGALGVRRAVSALGAPRETAELAAAAHAFGTIALPFGTHLYAHALVVALVAWSLALVLERRRFALAGALVAYAVVCDYNVALVAAALLGFVAAREGRRAALGFALGAAGPAVLLAAYHTACFGRPWRTPYDCHADEATKKIVSAAYGFSWPRPSVIGELLFGLRRGFLFTQPIALLALAGLVVKDRTRLFALGVAVVVILLHASRVHDWSAGASFGARYSTAALPFLALGYPRVLERLGRARFAAVAASALLALAGATTDWGYDVLTAWQTIAAIGPRAGAVLALFALDEHSLGAAALSALALAVALPVAVALLAGRRAVPIALAAFLPLAVSAHGVARAFFHPATVAQAHQDVLRAQLFRRIDHLDDRDEAVDMLRFALNTGDRELIAHALARVKTLEKR